MAHCHPTRRALGCAAGFDDVFVKKRQRHGERAAASEPRRHVDRPAVRVRDPLRDREAQPETAALARARARTVRAPEAVKDERQVRRCDAEPRVGDGESRVVATFLERECHRAVARRVLERIRREIQEHLPQTTHRLLTWVV